MGAPHSADGDALHRRGAWASGSSPTLAPDSGQQQLSSRHRQVNHRTLKRQGAGAVVARHVPGAPSSPRGIDAGQYRAQVPSIELKPVASNVLLGQYHLEHRSFVAPHPTSQRPASS